MLQGCYVAWRHPLWGGRDRVRRVALLGERAGRAKKPPVVRLGPVATRVERFPIAPEWGAGRARSRTAFPTRVSIGLEAPSPSHVRVFDKGPIPGPWQKMLIRLGGFWAETASRALRVQLG